MPAPKPSRFLGRSRKIRAISGKQGMGENGGEVLERTGCGEFADIAPLFVGGQRTLGSAFERGDVVSSLGREGVELEVFAAVYGLLTDETLDL